mmetsp:Transcript_19270/g.44649  ORF Transcript_19270/g.44649 Transcript_19270/m.44649 type:complete len:145 (-) Transcript_19270:260-694(-)
MDTLCNFSEPLEDSIVVYGRDGQALVNQQQANDDDNQCSSGDPLQIFQWPVDAIRNIEIPIDRICYSGDVLEAHARELPRQGSEFAEAQAEILRANSDVLQSQVSEGWQASLAGLANIPTAISDHWNYYAEIYYEQQRAEGNAY